MQDIIEKAIPMFISTALTFYLFYFNVPIWSAREIEELGKNGVWRYIFHLIATVGDLLYKAIESLCSGLRNRLSLKENNIFISLLNLGLFLGAIYGLQYVHEYFVTSLCMIDVAEVHFKNWTSFNLFRDLQIVGALWTNLWDGASKISFFGRIMNTLEAMLAYLILTIGHFAIMYGLLTNKCEDMNLIDRFLGNTPVVDALDYTPKNKGFVETLKKIGSSVLDFVNDLTMIVNFRVGATPFVFCVFLGGYSVVQVLNGQEADFGALLMDLLDETNILNLVFSFLIGFVVCSVLRVLSLLFYDKLPESAQRQLSGFSRFFNERADSIIGSREAWARANSFIRKQAYVPRMILEEED